MKRSNFLGKEINSGWRNVTAQERVNCYLEITPQGEKQKVVAYGTPGLTTFSDLGSFPVRGGISANDAIYCVVHSFFYKVDNAGTATQIGSISTDSGFVSMSSNGLQILISDGSLSGYIYTFSTGLLTLITDADYPAIRTNCFVDGYFVGNEINTGKYYISGLYDGTSWNALDFASAESNPDNIERVFEDHGGVMLLGTYTTEIVGDNGGQDFPFSRIGYPIEWGLMALQSVAKLGDATCFLAKNRMGESQVILLSGYSPQKVSTPDIESILAKTRAIESATAFAYMQNGHQFYQLNTVDNSFLYDMTSDVWTTVKSYGIDRHRANFGFNLVNKIIVSDYENGKLYTMRDDVFTDDGDPIIMEIIGSVNFNDFDRMSVHELQVDCETGDGFYVYEDTTPVVMDDPYWSFVTTCLDFDESAGTAVWHDQKTDATYHPRGTAANTSNYLDGGYNSLLLSGTSDWIAGTTWDQVPPTGLDFTLDMIIRVPDMGYYPLFDTKDATGSVDRVNGFLLYIDNGVPTLHTDSTDITFDPSISVGAGWFLGEWAYIRLSFEYSEPGLGSYRLSINGVDGGESGEVLFAGWNGGEGQDRISIGGYAGGSDGNLQIRKVRITAGMVRSDTDYALTVDDTPYHLQYTVPQIRIDKDPQIMLQTSKDYGHTWSTERWQSLGKIGEYLQRVRFSRLGRAYAFTFKLKISDPIKRAIIGVYLRASE